MDKKHETQNPSLTDPALLEKIDKLFACNVGEYVSLPQLVAVGDQSSGKSSVLEGLTGLPFPRDSSLCTRFATQIIFRRSMGQAARRIRASIIPGPQTPPECVDRLRAWSRSVTGSLEPEAFAEIMREAHTVMGVRTLDDPSKPTFSRHIFRLEISGPDEDHLSVVDVPGIFKTVTPGLTTKSDIEMVRNMVSHNMKNPRSIILAVVPANVDVATQEVIERAREVDPEGERTMGVITKPDLVDRGAEQDVLDLVAGKTMQLRHGWVLVRNLGKSELVLGGMSRKELEEELKKKEGWNSISFDRFGIESLRLRLQETVTEHARREFPKVQSDINIKLKEAKRALHAIPLERIERRQQIDFLLAVISRFQDLAANAVSGNYGRNEIFDKIHRCRLATMVRDRNDQYKADMIQFGHTYRFRSVGPETRRAQPDKSKDYPVLDEGHIITRRIDATLDIRDILADSEAVSPPVNDDIYQWLHGEYASSRGFELGTFNTSLLPNIMKRQSIKWESIALGYVSDIIALVHSFVVNVLTELCNDQRISRSLLSVIADGLQKQYLKAIEHTHFLLQIERSDTLMSLHQSFNETLQNPPELKAQKKIEEKAFHAGGVSLGKVVRMDDIRATLPGPSSTDIIIQQVHDVLQSYYNVALERFVDSVCMQSAYYYLLSGPNSPMKLLSPLFIYGLSDQELGDIAGEDPVARRMRQEFGKQIEELEVARKILL
ncbi:P-loop containing nucleoside triphosphate hydrolase protein [Aspergillus egyptiacus]|nr:P-loop containing nucleoside triphosphate hydrolase protein [Aspergillus egyptiacus]